MAGVAMDNDDYAKAATLFEQAMDVNVKCATTYMFRAQVRTTDHTLLYYCAYLCAVLSLQNNSKRCWHCACSEVYCSGVHYAHHAALTAVTVLLPQYSVSVFSSAESYTPRFAATFALLAVLTAVCTQQHHTRYNNTTPGARTQQ
jgi:hypothetical protein